MLRLGGGGGGGCDLDLSKGNFGDERSLKDRPILACVSRGGSGNLPARDEAIPKLEDERSGQPLLLFLECAGGGGGTFFLPVWNEAIFLELGKPS
mmetsp:Transcript_37686/g.69712  ORF Transcript_37686/g.69712 Transcript_37686/m.69712 type:complete len:95 (+) Transcript_37686:37-321(+)